VDGSHLTKDHAHATKNQNQVQLEIAAVPSMRVGSQKRGADAKSESLPSDFECKCACASGERLPLGGTERGQPYYSTSPMASCALRLRGRADGEVVGNIRCSTSSRNTNW
jgi:hypothetical protein